MNHPECEYVVLEGLEFGNKFMTSNHDNPELLANGSIGYKILGYGKTYEEALRIIYPTKADENRALANYIIDMYKTYSDLEAREIIN